MKVRFLKFKSWLLATAMGALGFASCHSHKQIAAPQEPGETELEERGEMRLMYGVPTMKYRVSGKVTDAKGSPVGGVSVNMLEAGIEATADTVMGDPDNVRKYLEGTAVKTDKDGRFEISGSDTPRESVRLLLRDTDGKANGSFKNKLLEIKVDEKQVDKEGAGGWNLGTFDTKVRVELERK